jgi:membrane-bound lytic murein transglycosylase B
MLKKAILFSLLLMVTNLKAQVTDTDEFAVWLSALKEEATAANISSETIEKTFKHAEYLPRVIMFDRAQPEFISPFLPYIERRITPRKIALGQEMLQTYAPMLSRLEQQYGVPRQILVSFWGLETEYGSNKGNYGLA